MLEFLKVPTLFLLYINDFLIMLSVILLSVLMMLLSAIAVKTDGSNLEEKSYFKKLWLSFSFKLNWIGFSLLLKLLPKKLEPWFVLWIFFSVTAKSVQKILHSWNLAKIFLVYSAALKKRYMKSQQGDALYCTSFQIVAFPKGNETKKEKKITTFQIHMLSLNS